jgi:ABC-type nitrate/sulfonate/bicarbonate transport system permease component
MHSLPNIFTGLKVGIGMAWMSVIASEMVGAQSGLGYMIQMNRLILSTDKVIVGMITIGLVGFLLNRLLTLIERNVLYWRKND